MDRPRTLLRPDGTIFFPPNDANIWDDLPKARVLRRRVTSSFYRFPDTRLGQLLGLTPLQTHVVICGYHRSGTTLLQAMMQHGFPNARVFPTEVGAWRAATYAWRNHALLISKAPQDVVRITQIRNFYKNRSATVRFILLSRDPRDVLTSTRPDIPGYCHHTGDWQVLHAYLMRHKNDPDALHLTYEQLVNDVPGTQAKIESFLNLKSQRPFEGFHTTLDSTFDARPLNGIRPVQTTGVARWKSPKHRARIIELLATLPSLNQALIDLGYETDTRWTQDYASGA